MNRLLECLWIGIGTLVAGLAVGCGPGPKVEYYPALSVADLEAQAEDCNIEVRALPDSSAARALQWAEGVGTLPDPSVLNAGDDCQYLGFIRGSGSDRQRLESSARREACRQGADIIIYVFDSRDVSWRVAKEYYPSPPEQDRTHQGKQGFPQTRLERVSKEGGPVWYVFRRK